MQPVHCSAHPRIQAIKPLAFPLPQSSILADGTFVPYLSSSSKSYTALWKSTTPFSLFKKQLFSVSTFPVASQTETVFFFSLLHYLLDLSASYLLSLSPYLAAKPCPLFTLYHRLHFILLCFGSDDLPLYPDPVPLKIHPTLCSLFPWSLCSQWLPPPTPSQSSPLMATACSLGSWYLTGQWDIGFKHPLFLVTPPPEQASFCTVHRITFLLSICLFHIIISPFSILYNT